MTCEPFSPNLPKSGWQAKKAFHRNPPRVRLDQIGSIILTDKPKCQEKLRPQTFLMLLCSPTNGYNFFIDYMSLLKAPQINLSYQCHRPSLTLDSPAQTQIESGILTPREST